jgi:SAM-dependent methyltransferase
MNDRYFTDHIGEYTTVGLRTDEEYVIDKYFKGRVLVLGCGTGRTMIPLQDKEFGVCGIDLNEEMVNKAKAKGLSVTKADARNLPILSEQFDTVFFPWHGIDYVYPDIYPAVKEAHRVLKPGGVFIFSSHNRFFIKKLCFLFKKYADYNGLLTYRTTPLDTWKLRRIFKKVEVIPRIQIAVSWSDGNWKDWLYKFFPIFSRSTYFICNK